MSKRSISVVKAPRMREIDEWEASWSNLRPFIGVEKEVPKECHTKEALICLGRGAVAPSSNYCSIPTEADP